MRGRGYMRQLISKILIVAIFFTSVVQFHAPISYASPTTKTQIEGEYKVYYEKQTYTKTKGRWETYTKLIVVPAHYEEKQVNQKVQVNGKYVTKAKTVRVRVPDQKKSVQAKRFIPAQKGTRWIVVKREKVKTVAANGTSMRTATIKRSGFASGTKKKLISYISYIGRSVKPKNAIFKSAVQPRSVLPAVNTALKQNTDVKKHTSATGAGHWEKRKVLVKKAYYETKAYKLDKPYWKQVLVTAARYKMVQKTIKAAYYRTEKHVVKAGYNEKRTKVVRAGYYKSETYTKKPGRWSYKTVVSRAGYYKNQTYRISSGRWGRKTVTISRGYYKTVRYVKRRGGTRYRYVKRNGRWVRRKYTVSTQYGSRRVWVSGRTKQVRYWIPGRTGTKRVWVSPTTKRVRYWISAVKGTRRVHVAAVTKTETVWVNPVYKIKNILVPAVTKVVKVLDTKAVYKQIRVTHRYEKIFHKAVYEWRKVWVGDPNKKPPTRPYRPNIIKKLQDDLEREFIKLAKGHININLVPKSLREAFYKLRARDQNLGKLPSVFHIKDFYAYKKDYYRGSEMDRKAAIFQYRFALLNDLPVDLRGNNHKIQVELFLKHLTDRTIWRLPNKDALYGIIKGIGSGVLGSLWDEIKGLNPFPVIQSIFGILKAMRQGDVTIFQEMLKSAIAPYKHIYKNFEKVIFGSPKRPSSKEAYTFGQNVGKVLYEIIGLFTGASVAGAAMKLAKSIPSLGKLLKTVPRVNKKVKAEIGPEVKPINMNATDNLDNFKKNKSSVILDKVYDLTKLAKTGIFKNKHAVEHVLMGNVNKYKKAGGFHYEGLPGSGGKIISGTKSAADKFGVYQGKVTVNGIAKTANKGMSTFFPSNWTPQEVVDAINEAYKSVKHVPGTKNTFRGKLANGMVIEMYLDKNKKIISAFPKYSGK